MSPEQAEYYSVICCGAAFGLGLVGLAVGYYYKIRLTDSQFLDLKYGIVDPNDQLQQEFIAKAKNITPPE